MKKLFRRPLNQAPISYTQDNGPMSLFTSGRDAPTENNLRAFDKSGTVHGLVTLIAESVAGQNWRLYRKTTDNRVRYSTADTGSDQRVEVYQHQALTVLNSPNPYMSRFELMEMSQMYLELTGEAWLIVEYAGSIPVGLWPARPDRMIPVPDPNAFISGYIYNGPNGEQVPFKPNEILLLKYPNPLTPYRGSSPLDSVMPDVDAGNYAAQYNRNFFLNDASPGGVITTPNELTDEEFDQFTNRWRETHRGVSRAHRVAILEAGMTWTDNHSSQMDMDFVNLVNNSRDKIRESYRVHPIMLGITDDVNRANAQTGEEVHTNWQTLPKLNRWRDFFNTKFLILFGSTGTNVEFDYVPPVPTNREQDNVELTTKATAAQTLVNAGFDPDDVLEVVGLPSMNVIEKATPAPALPPAWVPEMPAPPPASPGGPQPSSEVDND